MCQINKKNHFDMLCHVYRLQTTDNRCIAMTKAQFLKAQLSKAIYNNIFEKFSRLREIVLTFVVNFLFSRLREKWPHSFHVWGKNVFHVWAKLFSRLWEIFTLVGKIFHICGILTFVGIFTFEGSTVCKIPYILPWISRNVFVLRGI